MNKRVILYFIVLTIINSNAMATTSGQGIETPEYKTIKKLDRIEIRHYPDLVTASTIMGKSYSTGSGNGFRKVAGYIFGANERNEKISMTSPVIVELSDTMKMSFIMPSEYNLDDLPRPDNSSVFLQKQSPRTVAVIRYTGYNSDAKMEKYRQILITELKKNDFTQVGEFIFLGYNPPYRIINRRNEIMVEIQQDGNQF
jgi:SOUL heme-binding protein